MKKVLLFSVLTLIFGFGNLIQAQTTFSWRSESTNGNWNDGNNWWSGSTGVPTGGEIISFGNNVQKTMTNNLSATNRHKITFTSGASESRIINGATENQFYDWGGVMAMDKE